MMSWCLLRSVQQLHFVLVPQKGLCIYRKLVSNSHTRHLQYFQLYRKVGLKSRASLSTWILNQQHREQGWISSELRPLLILWAQSISQGNCWKWNKPFPLCSDQSWTREHGEQDYIYQDIFKASETSDSASGVGNLGASDTDTVS